MLACVPLSRSAATNILRGFDLEIAENGFMRKIGEVSSAATPRFLFEPPHSDLSLRQIADAWALVDQLAQYRLLMVLFSQFDVRVASYERLIESILGRTAKGEGAISIENCELRSDQTKFAVFSLIFSIIACCGHASLLFVGTTEYKILKLVDGLKILDSGPLVERG